MQNATEEGAGGQHGGGAGDALPGAGDDGGEMPVGIQRDIRGFGFEDRQIGFSCEKILHSRRVKGAIGLGAGAAHGGAFAAIEHFEMDTGSIGGFAHNAIERINLADQMALADAPNCGVAGHRADAGAIMGQEKGARAHARRNASSLGAGVAAADDDNVVGWVLLVHSGVIAGFAGNCRD